ncbi:MAG TPA: ketoacyl-ACP synthase III [Bacteroidales bacterium]|nr:ketoacyl-ACP synthase III [Bacteroidales bacterium]
MNLTFHNKSITGILTVLPSKAINFDDEIDNYNFSRAQSMKLKLAMGYKQRRVVDEDVCSSDLCIHGLEYLFEEKFLAKDEIDALILVTQSPDHFMPPTSNIIQGRLGLKEDIICLDINQGCAGYIIGLIQSFLMLEQESINKVALLNVDVLSSKVSNKDRNSNPLIGDGASVTIVEKSIIPSTIHANIKMDGQKADVLMIPAGGFRLPSSKATAKLEKDSSGNERAKDHLVMKGDDVFNFIMTKVPPLINSLLEQAQKDIEDIDYFMFHQPNKFILKKLADKLDVPYEKMPNNVVENFGNASGVSIPTAITHNLQEKLIHDEANLCLAGFGVGLTWSSMLIQLKNLKFCKTINY